MLDFLSISVQANPTNLALIYGDQTWTYAELNAHVRAVCGWLASNGIASGDHVGVLLPNTPDTVMLIHALMRIGAVLVPLNTRLTLDELTYQVRRGRCNTVICAEETGESAERLPVPALYIDRLGEGSLTPAYAPRQITLDTPQAVVFTSGTTGHPKGAVLTYGNHLWGATASAFRIGTLPHDRWLCPLPLYHVGGLSIIMRCCLYGTTVVLQNGFDLAAINHALDHQGVTLASFVPTMLYRLLETRRDSPPPPDFRLILLGGAAASSELVEKAHAAGFPVATTYGLTEACSQVATQTITGTKHKPGSVGKPLPFTSVRIVDHTEQNVPTGTHGEIVVSGPTVMRGYHEDEEATEKTLYQGELFTGDLGYLDSEGDLWLVQRRSDLIVSGGENVYPAEVENLLKSHPAVAEVCVVGLPHPEWGQQVGAAIVPKPESTVTDDELVLFCRQHLAGYKIPRRFLFTSSLPMTASGKIERRKVVDLFQ